MLNTALDGGINYDFPAGTIIPPGQFLVVANDAEAGTEVVLMVEKVTDEVVEVRLTHPLADKAIRYELEVECLPREIPSSFEADISEMDIGDSLHISAIDTGDVTLLVPQGQGNGALLVNFPNRGNRTATRTFNRAPFELVRLVAEEGKLPVPNFAAGGVATPADAALCRSLGAEAVFVGSGIFKSEDPAKRAFSILQPKGVFGVITGELAAWRARDLTRMLAWSSIGQLGVVFIAFSLPGAAGIVAGVAAFFFGAAAFFFGAAAFFAGALAFLGLAVTFFALAAAFVFGFLECFFCSFFVAILN